MCSWYGSYKKSKTAALPYFLLKTQWNNYTQMFSNVCLNVSILAFERISLLIKYLHWGKLNQMTHI